LGLLLAPSAGVAILVALAAGAVSIACAHGFLSVRPTLEQGPCFGSLIGATVLEIVAVSTGALFGGVSGAARSGFAGAIAGGLPTAILFGLGAGVAFGWYALLAGAIIRRRAGRARSGRVDDALPGRLRVE
jgi:hypothetical protein